MTQSADPFASNRWMRIRDQRTAGALVIVYLLWTSIRVLGLAYSGSLADVDAPGEPPTFSVDVNAAPLHELALLPGIGPALAHRIMSRRQDRPFEYIEQLREVPGIGPKTLDKLRGMVICGEGPQQFEASHDDI